MRHINQSGLDIIKAFEGFSSAPYVCPAGYLTIGYGHRIMKHESFPYPISRKEAETLLRHDVGLAERAISKAVSVPLNDNQFSALVSFVFNVGAGAFTSSTVLKKINAGEHAAIPNELLRWVWSKGKRLSGLVRRRQAEGRLYSLTSGDD